MANWWADKLAARHGDAPTPQPQPVYTPQAYAQPVQQQIPIGWVAYQTAQGIVYGPPPAQAVPMVGAQPFGAVDTSQWVVTQDNIGQLAGYWRGGQGTRTETTPCPKCGSPHYFSRVNARGTRGPAPAPLCMTCGFNGLFEQASAEVWGEVVPN